MPLPPSNRPKNIAAQIAEIRALLPTSLGSAELRDRIAADIRARAIFVSRLSSAIVLSTVKVMVDRLAAGEIDEATARVTIMQVVRAVGYTPEGGFPDDPPGTVPPAIPGSLQDLSSLRRINFILRTQLAMLRGRGQQLRGTAPERLRQFPAWELVRVQQKVAPRRWGGMHDGTPPMRGGDIDPRPRWIIAGGVVRAGGRLIALKGDPVWGELGSSGNFDDALDVDYPPFAFNSGMRWREVPRSECIALDVVGPDGESIDEWTALDHPTLVDTQSGLPAPQVSTRTIDPAVRDYLKTLPGIEFADEETATVEGSADEIRRRIAERRAARAAQRQRDIQKAIERGVKS